MWANWDLNLNSSEAFKEQNKRLVRRVFCLKQTGTLLEANANREKKPGCYIYFSLNLQSRRRNMEKKWKDREKQWKNMAKNEKNHSSTNVSLFLFQIGPCYSSKIKVFPLIFSPPTTFSMCYLKRSKSKNKKKIVNTLPPKNTHLHKSWNFPHCFPVYSKCSPPQFTVFLFPVLLTSSSYTRKCSREALGCAR